MMAQRVRRAPLHLYPRSRYALAHPYGGKRRTDNSQGVNGLTARDIKLVMEGGYNTVEAIAYTYERLPHATGL
jgi:hypothetical protein